MRKRTGSRKTSPPDYFFLSLTALLVVFGLVALSSASFDLAQMRFGDSYYYLSHQITNGLLVGIVGFLAGFLVYYRRWEKIIPFFLLATIGFLVMTFLDPFSIEVRGSSRWVSFGFFSFQPGELVKLSFLMYLAYWISKRGERINNWSEGFLPFLILTAVIVGLLFAQPATTTALIIIASVLVVYFVAGARFSFIAITVVLIASAVLALISITPYRAERIKAFLNPETDQLGSTYHINQALMSIGAGGWSGVGFGKSTTKLGFLPEPIGDSIFAVIAEEFGFIGASLLILTFFLFILKGFMIADKVPDTFGRLLVVGFVSLIGIQAFINIAAISGLIPLTGIPLPFISFGGTALAIFLTMSGMILNVSRYRR